MMKISVPIRWYLFLVVSLLPCFCFGYQQTVVESVKPAPSRSRPSYKFNATWTVRDFSKLDDQKINSPLYIPHGFREYQFWLNLYPAGSESVYADFLSLFLNWESPKDAKIEIAFTVWLMDSNSQPVITMADRQFFDTSSSWGYPTFARRSYVLDPKKHILRNDELTIVVEIIFTPGPRAVPGDTPKGEEVNSTNSEVGQKEPFNNCTATPPFGKYLMSRKYSDVVLKVGGRRFPAHKIILASRSKVFENLIDNSSSSKKTQLEVVIPSVRPIIFREVLRYLYKGEIKHSNRLIKSILVAAVILKIPDLQKRMEEELCKKIDGKNVNKLHILATKTNSHMLSSCCDHLLEISDVEDIKYSEEDQEDEDGSVLDKFEIEGETTLKEEET